MVKYLKIICCFIVGAVGGIFAEQILWPYFVERPLFYEYNLNQAPISVTQKTEVIVQENVALQDAVEKIKKSVVAINTVYNNKNISGSGIIVTSDGLMVCLAESLPEGGKFSFYSNGNVLKAEVLKRDLKNNFALVKIEGKNFLTMGFADPDKLRLGQRIFTYSFLRQNDATIENVKEGIIQSIANSTFETSFVTPLSNQGVPIFDIAGDLVGAARANADGKISVISVSKIIQFLGL